MMKKQKLLLFIMLGLMMTVGCQKAQGKVEVPTSTPTPEPMSTPIPTSIPTPEPTNTPTPSPTSTPTPEPTSTPTPSLTSTPMPEPTSTPIPIPTSTPTPIPTSTPTPELTSTPTPVPTNTPTPKPTNMPTPSPTVTPTPTVKLDYYTSETWKDAVVGDKVRFGTYEQDNNFVNGGEEIEWVIVNEDEERFMLLSVYALEVMNYSKVSMGSASWEKSAIREWLNNDFYRNSFSDTEREKIVITFNDNWYWYDEYHEVREGDLDYHTTFDDTKDYVFILSGNELLSIPIEIHRKTCNKISAYVQNKGYDIYAKAYMGKYIPIWTREVRRRNEVCITGYSLDGEFRMSAAVNADQFYLVYPAVWVSKDGFASEKTYYTNENIFITVDAEQGKIITGTVNNTLTQIYIPAVIDGKKVISVAEKAFSGCANLRRIKMPENVKMIDAKAFVGCNNLLEIYVPSSLENLDEAIIDNTPSIKKIAYSENVNTQIEQFSRYVSNKEIWEIIENDTERYGLWNLTYAEFIEMYQSIGTENDLFLEMLEEKNADSSDGLQVVEVYFEDIIAEKIYALNYAPFEYNYEDLKSGQYDKTDEEAYKDHGGVCSILAKAYRILLGDILGESDWKYSYFTTEYPDHEVLLVKTEDGRVFQVDNGTVKNERLGLKVVSEFVETDGGEDWYIHSTVSYCGIPEKVTSMAGQVKEEGYAELEYLFFE